MSESITRRTNALQDSKDARELRALLLAVRADNAELRTQFVALLAKLDSDGGVTDTNYAATLTPAASMTQE